MHRVITEALQHIEGNPGDWSADFETLRDKLRSLPAENVTELILLARQNGEAQSLFAMALADTAHPEAVDLYLAWLNSEAEELKLNGVLTLNALSSSEIDTANLFDGGHVDGAELERIAEQLRERWMTNPPKLATHAEWVAAQAQTSRYNEFERVLNLIESSPEWVCLGSGVVEIREGPLPANAGKHLVGAQAFFGEPGQTHFVVAQLDSTTGAVVAAYQKVNNRWIDVVEGAKWITASYQLSGTEDSAT